MGQDLHLFTLQRRQFAPDGRVAVDQPLLHRLVQSHLADRVATAHRAVRHARASALHIGFSPTLLHAPEDLLEFRLGQLVQRNVSQGWD